MNIRSNYTNKILRRQIKSTAQNNDSAPEGKLKFTGDTQS